MENKVIARAWVLEHGKDCDGCSTRGRVFTFSALEHAKECAYHESEWSDGMTYHVTEKWSNVVDYCNNHELNADNYIYQID